MCHTFILGAVGTCPLSNCSFVSRSVSFCLSDWAKHCVSTANPLLWSEPFLVSVFVAVLKLLTSNRSSRHVHVLVESHSLSDPETFCVCYGRSFLLSLHTHSPENYNFWISEKNKTKTKNVGSDILKAECLDESGRSFGCSVVDKKKHY